MGKSPKKETDTMGTVIDSDVKSGVEVFTSLNDRVVPGLDWSLSEHSRQAMREIDANLRAAEQISGRLMIG